VLNELDGAVGAFQSALGELGVEQNVVTFHRMELTGRGGVSGPMGRTMRGASPFRDRLIC